MKNNIKELITRSNEKISIRVLCQVSVLIALAIVLERQFAIIQLQDMRISFSFVPMMICGILFGPLWGAAAYGIADFIGWPLTGGAFIPLVLVSRIVHGFLFGLILHRENIRFFPHAFINSLSTQIICGMGLTTLGLSLIRGVPFFAMLWLRLPQIGILIVLQIAFFPVLLKIRDALRKSGLVPV